MAWNRSDNSSGKKVTQPTSKPVLKGLVAAVIVVLGAGAVLCYLRQSDNALKVEQKPKKTTQIAEATPAVVTNKVEKKKDVVIWRGQEYPKYDKDGGEAYITGYGVRYHSKVVITNDVAKKLEHWAAKHFKCPTDRRIAMLIDTEPGTAIIGGLKYDPTFTKRFKQSLEQPIVIDPNDPEDVKLIKQSVIDVRKDLAERLKKGEDIGQVIHETQNELQQLGAYKMELKREVEKIMRKPDMTEKDLDDCLGAANKMLEDRGLQPMAVPEIYRNGIRMRELRMKGKTDEGK